MEQSSAAADTPRTGLETALVPDTFHRLIWLFGSRASRLKYMLDVPTLAESLGLLIALFRAVDTTGWSSELEGYHLHLDWLIHCSVTAPLSC